jgi:hypothetical protein
MQYSYRPKHTINNKIDQYTVPLGRPNDKPHNDNEIINDI